MFGNRGDLAQQPTYAVPVASGLMAPPPPPPKPYQPLPGWKQKVDPSSGRHYYEDTVNGTTQWEQPTKAAEKPPPPQPVNRGRGQSQRGGSHGRGRGRGRGHQSNPRSSQHGSSAGGNDSVQGGRVSKPTHFIKREPDLPYLIKPEPDSD